MEANPFADKLLVHRISDFLFQRLLPEMSADIVSAALNTFLTIFRNKLLV